MIEKDAKSNILEYDVLILGRTRAGNMICVGGLTSDYQTLRLKRDAEISFWSPDKCPFHLGQWYHVKVEPRLDKDNPHHREDVAVFEHYFLNEISLEEIRNFLEKGRVIHYREMPHRAFNYNNEPHPMVLTQSGAFWIPKERLGNILESIVFWKCPYGLMLEEDRYHCKELNYNVKYVGAADPIEVITANTIIRLSTSSYWQEKNGAFLQLSGWF